ASPWVFLLPADLPSQNRGVAVIVEQDGTGRWGGALAEWSAEPFDVAASAGVAEGPLLGPESAAAGPGRAAAEGPTVITLVPPREPEVEGSTRFETIVSDSLVDRVDFLLDGKVVDSDTHRPFAARLDLASPARPQKVGAVAYDGEGHVLGRTELVVNGRGNRLRIAFDRWDHDVEAGRITVDARVDVPIDQRLDRVEFYLDETLVATRREPPFRAVIDVPKPGPTDYVRAVALLTDGGSIDTVELIAARGASERLDVTLVELYAVVTKADGQPVSTLTKDDFEIFEDGAPRPTEGFGYGQDVPLLLGVVVDSSGSMDGIMEETKQAAGRFLGQVLRPQDRAFVVDFDTLPRLAQGVTGDLKKLFASFRSMRAEGATAFYDSVVFSILQFGTERGRKALVVLTDGDDYRSRYSPSRAIEDARKAGVPIYVIGLGDSQQLQRTFKTSDLDDVTGKTGGRVFLISDPTQLGDAYDAIDHELRSQYLLTFYTPAGRQPGKIEVRAKRPGLKVRTVVGAL
ncbi:MAG: VWA domain-containing protein, partial [Acidobacteria bacterium]|nr:VWA domain-containing protein [Acidobacteriota bacterium]